MGKTKKNPVTQERLKELFDFKEDGLYWKVARQGVTKGKGADISDRGYKRITADGQLYLEHRLIWLYNYGEMPEFIDHIDGNTSNNSLDNLRVATHSENCRNRRMNSNNTTGVKGVHYVKSRDKWKAQLWFNGKEQYLGIFDSLDKAKKTINEARENQHKQFANYGV